VIKEIVFVWMGDGEPKVPETDLPPELFDDSFVFHDKTQWEANWRVALENMNDNHVRYVHRNSLQLLMLPFGKISYSGAKSIISGGGVRLTSYVDDSLKDRPYREYFPGVGGYWPKHTYRKAWTWIFNFRATRWLALTGSDGYQEENPAAPYLGSTREVAEEWNQGPHMPGMMRIDMGGLLYTRWCVPIDRTSTRLFYFYAVRIKSRRDFLWLKYLKGPISWKLLHTRNLGLQDGGVLQETRYDAPERFSAFDVETAGWRRLAILSALHGGRHDRIPEATIERLNTPGLALTSELREPGAHDG
jgi:phenylpropionate dioxygenase-like ring-hydroxylating dioxygenase large terminal subunit